MTALRDLLLIAAREALEADGVLLGSFYDPEEGDGVAIEAGVLDLGKLVEAIGRAALLDAAETAEQLRIGPTRLPAAPASIAARIRQDAEGLTSNH